MNNVARVCIAVLWVILSPADNAFAKRVVIIPPLYVQCFAKAGLEYHVDPVLLASIGYVESRYRTEAVGPQDKNGNRAYGLMQIYSTHIPFLQKYGVDKQVLLQEPCTNIRLGAWVLAGFQQKYGKTWKAVGAYNAGNLNWRRYEAAASYVSLVETVYHAIAPMRDKFVLPTREQQILAAD